jgi:cellulose synthase/poly-beta-1,6-N-acetylglucosamine synthase-like glycosyltransferase
VITTAATLVFWISAALLFFTYLGYPLLMHWLARLRPERLPAQPTPWPTLSIVLVAHNEAARIAPRIANLLASDYPPEKLEIILVSDGSTDATAAHARAIADPRVRILEQPTRAGKAAGLNAGLAAATGELIVFADARQDFAPGTLRALAAALGDPAFGAVSGELEIAASGPGVGGGLDLYWRLERLLRHREARWHSCIGCTGAVYAIRRALFVPLPADTVLDDVVIPLQIAAAGHRIGFAPKAKAFDPQALAPEKEQHRKRRTLAGNFQMLFRHPRWLFPGGHPLWWQIIAHKYLRLASPALLLLALATNLQLAWHPFYRAILFAQLAFYACALSGLALPAARLRLLSLPSAFLFLNFQIVRALWYYLRTSDLGRWCSSDANGLVN